MNTLRNATGYLAGAIENDVQGMCSWRDHIKNSLAHIGIRWMDPCQKPTSYGCETKETQAELVRSRAHGNFSFVAKEMELIRAIDLRMIDLSDFVVVSYDPAITTTGTHEEISYAIRQNKPVILWIVRGGMDAVPLWWFAEMRGCPVLDSVNGVIALLCTYDITSKDTLRVMSHNKWLLFDR